MPASAAAGICSGAGQCRQPRERRRRHEHLDRGRDERAETTNGIASTSSEPKTIRKFRSHAICIGWPNRANSADGPEHEHHPQPVRSGAARAGAGGAVCGRCGWRPSAVPPEPHRVARERVVEQGEPSGAVSALSASTTSWAEVVAPSLRSRKTPPGETASAPAGDVSVCACDVCVLPVPVRTIVASGTGAEDLVHDRRAGTLVVARLILDSATASRSGVASAPHPASRNPRTAASGMQRHPRRSGPGPVRCRTRHRR